MLVSVVVAAFNAESWIERVVGSLRAQTHDELEIVVVDDGSVDRTAAIVSRLEGDDPRVRLALCRHAGTAGAVTTGLVEARGEVVCLLSHDCYAEPDWVSRVVAALSDDPLAAIVRGPVLPARPIDVPFFHCTIVARDSRSFDGVCIAYRAGALDEAGRYFDEKLSRRGDDADLAWRMLERGHRHVWLDRPVGHHEVVPRSFRSGIASSRGVYRYALLLRKHPAMRSRLKLGFLWGGRSRYANVLLAHAALVAAVAGQRRLALSAGVALCAALAAEAALDSRPLRVRRRDRWLTMPLQKLAAQIVGTYALAYGSVRYRSPVL